MFTVFLQLFILCTQYSILYLIKFHYFFVLWIFYKTIFDYIRNLHTPFWIYKGNFIKLLVSTIERFPIHCGWINLNSRDNSTAEFSLDLISYSFKTLTFICPCIANIIPNYHQQDATFLDLFIFSDALHVSGGSSAHHQEHITIHTASGIVN